VTETGDILEVEHKDFHHWGIGIRTSASSKWGMMECWKQKVLFLNEIIKMWISRLSFLDE
jgi:hypothetical protein